jgi:hypothetical protein
VVHEACRDTRDFPRSANDLWLTDTGQVVTARADDDQELIDPRSSVAAMLEAMLPHESSDDPDHVVSPSLRGLPSRLRGKAPGGRRDLEDLMAILRWHSGGVPRQIVRELADRVRNPQPQHTDGAVAPIDALDLFPAEEMPSAPHADRARTQQLVGPRMVAVLGATIVLAGISTVAYRWFRHDEPKTAVQSDQRCTERHGRGRSPTAA